MLKKPMVNVKTNWLKTNCMILLVLIIAAAFITTTATCSKNTGEIYLEKQKGETVKMKTGDIFEVKLEANPTTGYDWYLSGKTDASVVILESSTYEVSSKNPKLVGGGGIKTLKFKAAGPGQTKLILEYVRPWEKGVEPANTFTLDIKVE
jgi:inhibitor of cysteine peptidase